MFGQSILSVTFQHVDQALSHYLSAQVHWHSARHCLEKKGLSIQGPSHCSSFEFIPKSVFMNSPKAKTDRCWTLPRTASSLVWRLLNVLTPSPIPEHQQSSSFKACSLCEDSKDSSAARAMSSANSRERQQQPHLPSSPQRHPRSNC